MKIRKIGAVVAGALMLGSTLCAAVAASDVPSKDFLITSDGKPAAMIVVGESAAATDVVAASLLAAKIGSLAVKTEVVNLPASRYAAKHDNIGPGQTVVDVPDATEYDNAYWWTPPGTASAQSYTLSSLWWYDDRDHALYGNGDGKFDPWETHEEIQVRFDDLYNIKNKEYQLTGLPLQDHLADLAGGDILLNLQPPDVPGLIYRADNIRVPPMINLTSDRLTWGTQFSEHYIRTDLDFYWTNTIRVPDPHFWYYGGLPTFKLLGKEYTVIEGSHVLDYNTRTGQRGSKYGTPYLTTGKAQFWIEQYLYKDEPLTFNGYQVVVNDVDVDHNKAFVEITNPKGESKKFWMILDAEHGFSPNLQQWGVTGGYGVPGNPWGALRVGYSKDDVWFDSHWVDYQDDAGDTWLVAQVVDFALDGISVFVGANGTTGMLVNVYAAEDAMGWYSQLCCTPYVEEPNNYQLWMDIMPTIEANTAWEFSRLQQSAYAQWTTQELGVDLNSSSMSGFSGTWIGGANQRHFITAPPFESIVQSTDGLYNNGDRMLLSWVPYPFVSKNPSEEMLLQQLFSKPFPTFQNPTMILQPFNATGPGYYYVDEPIGGSSLAPGVRNSRYDSFKAFDLGGLGGETIWFDGRGDGAFNPAGGDNIVYQRESGPLPGAVGTTIEAFDADEKFWDRNNNWTPNAAGLGWDFMYPWKFEENIDDIHAFYLGGMWMGKPNPLGAGWMGSPLNTSWPGDDKVFNHWGLEAWDMLDLDTYVNPCVPQNPCDNNDMFPGDGWPDPMYEINIGLCETIEMVRCVTQFVFQGPNNYFRIEMDDITWDDDNDGWSGFAPETLVSSADNIYGAGDQIINKGAAPPAGTVLLPFSRAQETYWDMNGNVLYDEGESIIWDTNLDGLYNLGDHVISGPNPLGIPPPLGQPLVQLSTIVTLWYWDRITDTYYNGEYSYTGLAGTVLRGGDSADDGIDWRTVQELSPGNYTQTIPVDIDETSLVKLDVEVTENDKAQFNFILIGGPVANLIAKNLVDLGIAPDDGSPTDWAYTSAGDYKLYTNPYGTGKSVLIVAGADRDKTRYAAEQLIAALG